MINGIRKILSKSCNCSQTATENRNSIDQPSEEPGEMSVPEVKQDVGTASDRCYRAGNPTRNPFFNFLREFRRNNCGISITEIAVQGAQEWRQMSDEQKCPFIALAYRTPKRTQKARRMKRLKRE